jgi:hypothetical protein
MRKVQTSEFSLNWRLQSSEFSLKWEKFSLNWRLQSSDIYLQMRSCFLPTGVERRVLEPWREREG